MLVAFKTNLLQRNVNQHLPAKADRQHDVCRDFLFKCHIDLI